MKILVLSEKEFKRRMEEHQKYKFLYKTVLDSDLFEKERDVFEYKYFALYNESTGEIIPFLYDKYLYKVVVTSKYGPGILDSILNADLDFCSWKIAYKGASQPYIRNEYYRLEDYTEFMESIISDYCDVFKNGSYEATNDLTKECISFSIQKYKRYTIISQKEYYRLYFAAPDSIDLKDPDMILNQLFYAILLRYFGEELKKVASTCKQKSSLV